MFRPFLVALFALSTAAMGGAIPFQMVGGLIVFEGRAQAADGHMESLRLVFDTGAESSLIDARQLDRLGWRKGRGESIRGVGVRTQGWWVGDVRALAGGAALPEKMLAVDLRSLVGNRAAGFDGVVGADFLRNKIVQIDYENRVLRMLPKGAQVEGRVVPLRRTGSVLCAKVSLDGGPSEWVRVDTGCESAMQWCGDARVGRGGTSVGLSGQKSGSGRATVGLGGVEVPNVPVGLHRGRFFAGESGLLGNGLLSRFTVTIDGPGKRLLLN